MSTENFKPAEKPRFMELDSVRALAALWVFAYHVWQFGGSPVFQTSLAGLTFDLFAPVHHGPVGVDIFMVLSGFCLFWPLTRKAASFAWKEYALRRARRILPAYYGAIGYAILAPALLVSAVRMIGWQANVQPIPSLRQIVTHLLFVHTLFPDTWDGITGAFWSMGLEAQFYVVFPFLVWAWQRIGVRAIAYAALASLVFRIVVGVLTTESQPVVSFLLSITFLGRWMQFAAGMAAALWVRQSQQRPRNPSDRRWLSLTMGGLLFGAAGLVAPTISHGPVPLRDLLLAGGSAALLAGVCAAPNWIKLPLTRGPLPILGRISYSFFLIHQPTSWYVMEFFRKKLGFSGPQQVLLGYTAGLVISTVFSIVFFRIFEKPFLSVGGETPTSRPIAAREPQSVS